MRILITGGAGFIGSHLCDRLVARGDEVVVLDDLSSGKRANLAGVDGRITLIKGDVLGDLSAVPGTFDAVVHLAALISGYDSLHDPHAYVKSNILALLEVIDFVRERGMPRLLFASSSTVYGAAAAERLTEEVLPAPMTVYAASKLMGEHLLAMYGPLHGFSHCSLRLFNVYGPRQAPDHPYANVTCKFAHAAAVGLPIDLYGDGEQSRDFVFVDDVVDAFLRVLPESRSSLYNVGTGEEHRILDLVAVLEEATGRPFAIERKSGWPNDIRRISADCRRAASELGYTARTPLHDGLLQTLRFFEGERARRP